MRQLFLQTLIIAWIGLTPIASAQSDTPRLVGTWVSVTGEVGHWSGTLKPFGKQTGRLVVEEQLGGVFRGTMTYHNEKDGPKFEGKEGVRYVLTEPVFGVIDWDGKTIVWVDHDDETVHRAKLVNESTMQVIAYEPGPYAVVNRMIMIRK